MFCSSFPWNKNTNYIDFDSVFDCQLVNKFVGDFFVSGSVHFGDNFVGLLREHSESFFFGPGLFLLCMIGVTIFNGSFLIVLAKVTFAIFPIFFMSGRCNIVIFFGNNRGFLEIDLLIDNWPLNQRVGKHARKVDVLESVIFSLSSWIAIGLEAFFHFYRSGLMRRCKKGEAFLMSWFERVEEVDLFIVKQPAVVFDVRRFEPVLFSAPVHV